MPPTSGDGEHVVIVGGGWAGLAAAIALVDAGSRVTVVEAARVLGGRARRVTTDGMILDNGQHLLLGAYRETLRLIERVHRHRPADELYLRMPLCLAGPRDFRVRAAQLPAPLHMLHALVFARGCTLRDRWALVRTMSRWMRAGWRSPPRQTVGELLSGQPKSMVDRLWSPLCLAALNTPIHQASAQIFLNVLRDTLAADRASSDLVIPRVDLSTLFPEAAARVIEDAGGSVRRGVRVVRITGRGESGSVRVEAAAASGLDLKAKAVIIATAPWNAAQLLDTMSPTPESSAAIADIGRYEYLPICTIYLRYATPIVLPSPMMQLEDGPGQWVFGAIDAVSNRSDSLSVVISADGPHRKLSHAQIVDSVLTQLARNIAAIEGRAPIASQVITERRSTFACTPGRAHPIAGAVGPGVYLAGDHTDSDYPATLEAACRSGIRVAEALLADIR